MTFSDHEVVKLLTQDFVCAWMNKSPKTKYADGLYASQESPKGLSNGTGYSNVTAIFATAGGTILHAIPGYLDPPSFKRQVSVALSISRLMKLADIAEMSREHVFREAHLREAKKGHNFVEEKAHQVLGSISRLMGVEEFPPGLYGRLGG